MAEGAVQACPICGASLKANPRYPDHVCAGCEARTADADGRPVRYHNAAPDHPDLIDSLRASYADGTPYRSETCYIDGVKCRAREAHMGGVVVRPAGKKGPWGSPKP